MSRRSIAAHIGCLATAVLVTVDLPLAHGSGDPQESPLYRNFVRASEALDRAIAAHGGASLIDRSASFRITYRGTYLLEGHFARPWAHKDYRLEATTIYSADLRAMKTELTFYDGDKPTPTFTIVGPSNGLTLSGGASRPDSIPVKELATTVRQELELLPHEYLRQARASAASMRLLSDSDSTIVITYTLESGEGRALILAADTHLLTRVERIDHWKHKGDRLEWRTFEDYVERGGIKVPVRSHSHIERSSGQNDVISEIVDLEVGAPVSVDAFTVPAASRAGFESWTLERQATEDPNALLPSHDLGGGAYVIDLPPSDARSLLVGFSNFSVIVEAGDYSEISARLLATADHLLPGKPVRYVAMTHHHPLYASGLRPYAQRGITILATAGDTAYYRDLTTRPYRIRPDAQQRDRHPPRFQVIDGKHVIKDGKRSLELHEYDYSTHVDEFVLPYLPSHELIVTADQVYVLRGDSLRAANVRERAVHRVVKERKLKVRSIMQTWFLSRSDSLVPYASLVEKVRLAEAKSAKK